MGQIIILTVLQAASNYKGFFDEFSFLFRHIDIFLPRKKELMKEVFNSNA